MNRFIADSMRYFLKSSRIMALLKGNKAEESGNMMQLLSITKKYHVSKPLESSDVPELKRMGFARIICNLPDGEISGVTQSREIAAACAEAGIDFEYIPVSVTKITPNWCCSTLRLLFRCKGMYWPIVRRGADAQ